MTHPHTPRPRSTWAVLAAALLHAACNDSAASPSAADGGAPNDAGVGGPADAAASERDGGGSPPAVEAGAVEAGASDAAASDGAAPDAAVGPGIAGLRAHICSPGAYGTPLPSPQPVATPVGSERYGFVEGPVWVEREGMLYFSDMSFGAGDALGPPSAVRSLRPDGQAGTWLGSSGSNGLALGPGGELIAATHDTQSLTLFAVPGGERTDLVVRYDGKRLNSPNDLVLRSDGTVYFTDPDWQLGSTRTSETGITGAYRVPPPLAPEATLAAQLFEGGLDKPNGIALSPDERTLYLGSSGADVFAYDLGDDGTPSGRRVFASPGGSDGMTVDCAGNLYVAAGAAVRVFSPAGDTLGSIGVAETPSNVAFGGADHQTLYITAQTRVYAIALGVPGFPY